jgi:hypothetical protein
VKIQILTDSQRRLSWALNKSIRSSILTISHQKSNNKPDYRYLPAPCQSAIAFGIGRVIKTFKNKGVGRPTIDGSALWPSFRPFAIGQREFS